MVDNLVLNILAFHIRGEEISSSQLNVLILRSYKVASIQSKNAREPSVVFSHGIAAGIAAVTNTPARIYLTPKFEKRMVCESIALASRSII